MKNKIKKYEKNGKKNKIAIIFDMRTVGKISFPDYFLFRISTKFIIIYISNFLDFIFTSPEKYNLESNLLANILMRADSVICARSTPKQKAKIVKFVRSRGKICVAIGDGANDVNMIRVKI